MCREVIEFRQHDSETFYFLANLKAGVILQYDGYIYISFDLCEAHNRTGEFQRCICPCVVNTLEMTSFASVS